MEYYWIPALHVLVIGHGGGLYEDAPLFSHITLMYSAWVCSVGRAMGTHGDHWAVLHATPN